MRLADVPSHPCDRHPRVATVTGSSPRHRHRASICFQLKQFPSPPARIIGSDVLTIVRRVVIRVSMAVALVACVPTQIDSAYWWRSPRFVTALGLTAAQASAIDRIYRETLPERLERVRESEAARARFERLLDSHAPDEELEAAASQAAAADAARSRLRTLMLYRMSRVLTPTQRSRLKVLARSRGHTRRNASP